MNNEKKDLTLENTLKIALEKNHFRTVSLPPQNIPLVLEEYEIIESPSSESNFETVSLESPRSADSPIRSVSDSPVRTTKNKTRLMYNISRRSPGKNNENITAFKSRFSPLRTENKKESPDFTPVISSDKGARVSFSETLSGAYTGFSFSDPCIFKKSRSKSAPRPHIRDSGESSRSFASSASTYSMGSQSSAASKSLLEADFRSDARIEDILEFIFRYKLRLSIDFKEYEAIFKKNLIITYEILCKQTLTNIEKLGLPLALETEIKLIIENKNSKKIKTIKDLNNDTKQKLKDSWTEIRNTPHKLDSFINTFYKNFYYNKSPKRAQELIKHMGIQKQINKLISTISLLLNFIDGDVNKEELTRLSLIHLLHNINYSFYDAFALSLATSICEILDPEQDSIYYATNINSIKNAWYIVAKSFGDLIYEEYNHVKKGKLFQVYIKRGHHKWNKKYINICHDKLIISTFPKFENPKIIMLEDIIALEKISNDDNHVTKETEWCFKLGCKDVDYYICTDLLDVMNELYESIKIRMDIFETLIES